MAKNKYKPFLYLILILVAVIVVLIFISKYREQQDKFKELEQNVTELQEIIETNQTIVTTPNIINKQSGWAILFFLSTVGLIIYIIFNKKQSFGENELEECLKFWKGTAEKCYEDGYWKKIGIPKLGKFHKFYGGEYKRDLFPAGLLVFVRKQGLDYENKPPVNLLIGIVFNRKNMKKVYEIFDEGNRTVEEMIKSTRMVVNGMRGLHYESPEPKAWERDIAVAQAGAYSQFEQQVEREVAVRTAVEDRI